jgi:hypothetical protein
VILLTAVAMGAVRMQWSGVTRSPIGFSDPMNQFSGDFFESSATVS